MARWLHRCLCLALLATAVPAMAEWQETGAEAPLAGAPEIRHTEWTSPRPPNGSYDKIRVHRYRGPRAPRAALLYLPGTFMNGRVAVHEEDFNPWLFLASRGIEVFTLDYRTHALPSEGELAAPAMLRDWTTARFVDDAVAALELSRRLSGQRRVFLAGFSRGAFLAYAVAANRPGVTAGVAALDGYFKSHDPDGDFDFDAAMAKLEQSGHWADDVGGSRGWEARQALMQATARDPFGDALGEAPEGVTTVGDQLAAVLYGAWGPGALSNPVDGYSRVQILARLMGDYDRYYPTIQNLEGASIAAHKDDPRTPVDDGWSRLQTPAIFFGSTGMGPKFLLGGIASAAHVAGRDAEIHVLEGHGHLDVLVGEGARRAVYEPLLAWLYRHSIQKTAPEASTATP